MGQGGAGNTDAAKTDTNEKLARMLLEHCTRHPDLVEKINNLLFKRSDS